ncbi:MAG TPA: hypothetical protein VFR97_15795 [Capillimicrobium sp.]|nr:hypothetical protein [Capillimicrobium sp.]
MTLISLFAQGGSENLGATALYLVLAWLASSIVASWLSARAGYSEKVGLATGLLLTVVGALVWLVIYLVAPREGSRRKIDGVIPKRRRAGEMDMATRPGA